MTTPPDADYISNYGNGPLLARVIRRSGAFVEMERWHKRSPKLTTRFKLRLSYLKSEACGWRMIK